IETLKGKDSAFLDRLTLNEKRIQAMSEGIKQIVLLPDPVGEVTEKWTAYSGLQISKVRAPLGVIGVIYEARPNVTIDVAGLCIKTGNSVILRGGSDAINSNRALYKVMKEAIEGIGISSNFIQFVNDTDRSLTMEMLKQGDYIDVIIPRGGDKLKQLVLENATMPVIASSGGNCHIYVDNDCDLDLACKVILNAKVQRPTVCNALEQLLINKDILAEAVPKIFAELDKAGVLIKCDEECAKYYSNVQLASEEDYFEEHISMVISVKSVASVDDAINHINIHSTGHSEAIISNNQKNIDKFTTKVDSGCVYVNASTRFTDGFEFGFGAEIGISTQKLHARGPLGLKQLTSEKYICVGNGTIRK
ncbi:MAG TPA: glutamate-5-semialdehyde dehydrogenase, partial [Clostridia bacterium]|nr:glutamate-5-semialdehyde dehydrogenase [Clostridia bacterium]